VIDIGDYYADFGKIKRELGWLPQVSLADGLDRSLTFYRSNLERYL
jgi:UDP-glucose 4-epimerase